MGYKNMTYREYCRDMETANKQQLNDMLCQYCKDNSNKESLLFLTSNSLQRHMLWLGMQEMYSKAK